MSAFATPLPVLDADERRGLTKMGDKSEAFCRQTLVVLAQNPQVVPPTLDLAEAECALGIDVMSASLEGYALLKVLGKGSGLETLRPACGPFGVERR